MKGLSLLGISVCIALSNQIKLINLFDDSGAQRFGWYTVKMLFGSVRWLPSSILTKYLRLNARSPITTAIGTSAVLWIVGDSVAQNIEARGEPKPLDTRRLIATTMEGSLVNGGVGCLWYKLLDSITTKRSTRSSSLHFSFP